MVKVFEICFYTGLIFVIISFIFGEVFNVFHINNHVDFNSHAFVSPLRPSMIAVFITVFGGTGMILANWALPIAILCALAAALLSAFGVYRFILVPLTRAQSTSSPTKDQLIGLPANLILGITDGSFGEITYTINGNSYSAPCRAKNESTIPAGTEVVIIDIVDGVFFIQRAEWLK